MSESLRRIGHRTALDAHAGYGVAFTDAYAYVLG